MDDITAQLEDGMPGDESIQTGHIDRVGRRLPYTYMIHYVDLNVQCMLCAFGLLLNLKVECCSIVCHLHMIARHS